MESVVIESYEKVKNEKGEEVYTVYDLKCKNKEGKEYMLKKRYKQLETYYYQLTFQLLLRGVGLPKFPPKIFGTGNMLEENIKKRMSELNTCFNIMMQNNEIKVSLVRLKYRDIN